MNAKERTVDIIGCLIGGAILLAGFNLAGEDDAAATPAPATMYGPPVTLPAGNEPLDAVNVVVPGVNEAPVPMQGGSSK